jgi:Ca2+-binding RTX toxin-like protein
VALRQGTPKADVIVGLGGNDKLIGKGGKDLLNGGPGKDNQKQ